MIRSVAARVLASVLALPLPIAAAAAPALQSDPGRGFGGFVPLAQGPEGDQPMDVVLALGGSVAVVALRDTDNLEFYDAATGVRLGEVAVPVGPVDLDPTPDGTRVFVACRDANRVALVDVASRAVLSSTPTSRRPFQVSALSDGARALVACDDTAAAGRIDIVHGPTGSVLASGPTVPLTPVLATSNPSVGIRVERHVEIAVTPDDTTAIVPGFGCRCIDVVDVATAQVVQTIAGLPSVPYRAVAAPDGSYVAVGSHVTPGTVNRLYLMDLPGPTLREVPIAASSNFPDVAITPDSSTVLYGATLRVVRVDAAMGQVTGGALVFADRAEIEVLGSTGRALVTAPATQVVNIASMTSLGYVPIDTHGRAAVDPTSGAALVVSPLNSEVLARVEAGQGPLTVAWETPLGVPEELDAPYAVALTDDERTAVVTCTLSDNLAVVDLDLRQVRSVVPLGARPADVALLPGDQVALVGVETVSAQGALLTVDLASGAVLGSAPLPSRVQRVFVTPDGARAVVVGAGGNEVTVDAFDLGAGLPVPAGSLGIPGSTWTEAHLSPDGRMLAGLDLAGATFVDVATLGLVFQAPNVLIASGGNWSPDSTRFAWATNVADLVIADVSDPAAVSLTTIPGPLDKLSVGAAFDAAGTHVYHYQLPGRVRVLELASGNEVAAVDLPGASLNDTVFFPRPLEVLGDQLLVVRSERDAAVIRLAMDGPATRVLEAVPFATEGAARVAFSHRFGRVLLPTSVGADGLRLVDYGGLWSSECGPAAPNSSGVPARMGIAGPLLAGDQALELKAYDLPPGAFGMFIGARNAGAVAIPGSQGTLCLSGSIGRFLDSIQQATPAGTLHHATRLDALPIPGVGAVLAGDTLRFQAWYRDVNPAVTSNLTDAARVRFR